VNVRADSGNVILSKLPLPPIGGERTFIAAVLLGPGDVDQGTIPLGARVNASAPNITGAKIVGTREIWTVALEMAFAEKRAGDQTVPTQPPPLVVVITSFAPREVVTSKPMSWR
jgi:hypothetical protein